MNASHETPAVALLGIGSVLMGDDGFGPWFVHRFAGRFAVEGATIEDLGTPGSELAYRLLGLDAVLIVDALRLPDAPPGSVRSYDREEILRHSPGGTRAAHDPGLRDALLTADFAGTGPSRVLLVGVVPERIELGAPRSLVVEAAADEVERRLLAELRGLGCTVTGRVGVDQPTWWDRESTPRAVPEGTQNRE